MYFIAINLSLTTTSWVLDTRSSRLREGETCLRVKPVLSDAASSALTAPKCLNMKKRKDESFGRRTNYFSFRH